MILIVLGLNHKTAPVDIREKLAVPSDELPFFLKKLLSIPQIKEGLILSTCNRVELWVCCENKNLIPQTIDNLLNFICERGALKKNEVQKYFYVFRDKDALGHIFRVSSSLDSMIIGEPQILGQVKEGWKIAEENNALGFFLNRVLTQAVTIAKQVRTETGVGKGGVSVGFVAVQLAKEIFSTISNSKVLLIGAGKIAELTAKNLKRNGVMEVMVTNRSFHRAVNIAQKYGWDAKPFENLADLIISSDIIISAAGGGEYIITKNFFSSLEGKKKYKLYFIIDLGVPRSCDPAIGEFENVYLYDIDDLEGIIKHHLDERKMNIAMAEKIIERSLNLFDRWIEDAKLFPLIKALTQRLHNMIDSEVKESEMYVKFSEEQREVLMKMTNSIVKKFFYDPIKFLKKEGGIQKAELIEMLIKMFNLNINEKSYEKED